MTLDQAMQLPGCPRHLLPGKVVRLPDCVDVPLDEFIAVARQHGCAVVQEYDIDDDEVVRAIVKGQQYRCYGANPMNLTPDINVEIVISTTATWQQVVATLQPLFEGVLTPGEIADAKKLGRGKFQPGDILAWTEDLPKLRTVEVVRRQGLPFSIVSDEREIMLEVALEKCLQAITISSPPSAGVLACTATSARRNDDNTWTLSYS